MMYESYLFDCETGQCLPPDWPLGLSQSEWEMLVGEHFLSSLILFLVQQCSQSLCQTSVVAVQCYLRNIWVWAFSYNGCGSSVQFKGEAHCFLYRSIDGSQNHIALLWVELWKHLALSRRKWGRGGAWKHSHATLYKFPQFYYLI